MHVPVVSQPKSKPEILIPANLSFPALEAGVEHEPDGAGAEPTLVGLAGAEVGGTGAEVGGAGADVATPGIHCE